MKKLGTFRLYVEKPLLGAASLLLFLSGCSGTTFQSNASKGSNLTSVNPGLGSDAEGGNGEGNKEENGGKSGSEGDQSDVLKDGESPIETDQNGSGKPDGTGTGTGTETDLGGAGKDGGPGLNKECLSKKASEYNIAIVIDTSGSQRQSDPNNLRIKAANAFIADLVNYAKGQPAASVEVGVVGFSDVSKIGAAGAVDVGKSGGEALAKDITDLNAVLGPKTNFEAGLINGEILLGRMGAKKGVKTQRNFMIFLSDGAPNMSPTVPQTTITSNPTALKDAILNNVKKIVSSTDTAMLTIASGTLITPEGTETVKSMALPAAGAGTYQDHVGKYIRVDSEKTFETLSKTLGSLISDCK